MNSFLCGMSLISQVVLINVQLILKQYCFNAKIWNQKEKKPFRVKTGKVTRDLQLVMM